MQSTGLSSYEQTTLASNFKIAGWLLSICRLELNIDKKKENRQG